MMSITKQSKWANSQAVLPKDPQETLSSGEDDSTESLNSFEYSENSEPISGNCTLYDCSAFVTQPDPRMLNTSLLSGSSSVLNVRPSLELYKFKAASTIQYFFKAKKNKQKVAGLISTWSKCQDQTIKKWAFGSFKAWVSTQEQAAKVIQLSWKVYKGRISLNLPSPRRNMLARAVSIGGSILKIQALIEKVVSRRSSPSSPCKEVKGARGRLSQQMRSQSFSINLIQSACEDENETQDSKPSTPALEVWSKHARNQSTDSTWESVSESVVLGSFVMKREFKVRTKRRSRMNVDELSKALERDLELGGWICQGEESCVPLLKKDSKFCSFQNFEITKKELICEYKDLIKY